MERRKYLSLLLFGALILPVTAKAESPKVNVERFTPSPHAEDMMSVRTAQEPAENGLSGGAFITYGKDPLRFIDKRYSDTSTFEMVNHQAVADLFLSYLLWKQLSFGVTLPVVLFSGGDDGLVGAPPADATGFGDVVLGVKWLAMGRTADGFGLALDMDLTLPTASDDTFAGDKGVTVIPRLVADWRMDDTTLAVNLGYRVRQSQELGPYETGTEVQVGLGARQGIWNDRAQLLAELLYAAPPDDDGGDSGSSLEGQIGANLCVGGVARVFAAGGGGFLDGIGDTSLRLTAGVRVEGCGRPEPPPPPPDPDRDKDGIKDKNDACPDTPGVSTDDPKTNGCPPDRDGDGIYDKDDACPDTPGVASDDPKKHGCPSDRDGDGIYDKDDACPDTPGIKTDDPKTHGCPKPPEPIKYVEVTALVEFETDKTRILQGYTRVLDEMAQHIIDNPGIKKVIIEGHTDNQASAEYNLELSARRAKAVKKYLVKKGVERKRLHTKGYGMSKPVADNSTEEGRRQNRRVVFKLSVPEKKKAPEKGK